MPKAVKPKCIADKNYKNSCHVEIEEKTFCEHLIDISKSDHFQLYQQMFKPHKKISLYILNRFPPHALLLFIYFVSWRIINTCLSFIIRSTLGGTVGCSMVEERVWTSDSCLSFSPRFYATSYVTPDKLH